MRKVCPPWSVPLELFHVLLLPRVLTAPKPTTIGLGHQTEAEEEGDVICNAFLKIQIHMRGSNLAPLVAHRTCV